VVQGGAGVAEALGAACGEAQPAACSASGRALCSSSCAAHPQCRSLSARRAPPCPPSQAACAGQRYGRRPRAGWGQRLRELPCDAVGWRGRGGWAGDVARRVAQHCSVRGQPLGPGLPHGRREPPNGCTCTTDTTGGLAEWARAGVETRPGRRACGDRTHGPQHHCGASLLCIAPDLLLGWLKSVSGARMRSAVLGLKGPHRSAWGCRGAWRLPSVTVLLQGMALLARKPAEQAGGGPAEGRAGAGADAGDSVVRTLVAVAVAMGAVPRLIDCRTGFRCSSVE
jgi:hypothetical protein